MASEDQVTLYVIRGYIAGLSAEQQEKVSVIASQIREITKDSGAEGLLALSLVGAEQSLNAP